MKTLSCRRAEKLIPLHAAGDLPAGRRERAVAAHVAACQACGRLAEEFRASREWAREAAAVPEFGEEFYEQLRAGVLSQIRRDDRPAASRRVPFLAALSGRRLAYAASFALVVAAFALALGFYLGRDARAPRQNEMAGTSPGGELVNPPPRAHAPTQPAPGAPKTTAQQQDKRGAGRDGRRGAKPKDERGAGTYKRTPTLRRAAPLPEANRAPEVAMAATPEVAPSTANAAQPESAARAEVAQVSRIEIQTADPTIRIIWLAPSKGEETEPAEADPRR